MSENYRRTHWISIREESNNDDDVESDIVCIQVLGKYLKEQPEVSDEIFSTVKRL